MISVPKALTVGVSSGLIDRLIMSQNACHLFLSMKWKKTFNDLTDDDLLNRCLKGLTQNQNEALNSVLWSKAMKTKFIGRKRLLIAVCNTICQFNTGSAHKASLLESFGLSAGMNSLTGFHKADEERIKNADRKTSLKSRTRRRKLRGLRKSKGEKVKTTYHPGAFGT